MIVDFYYPITVIKVQHSAQQPSNLTRIITNYWSYNLCSWYSQRPPKPIVSLIKSCTNQSRPQFYAQVQEPFAFLIVKITQGRRLPH